MRIGTTHHIEKPIKKLIICNCLSNLLFYIALVTNTKKVTASVLYRPRTRMAIVSGTTATTNFGDTMQDSTAAVGCPAHIEQFRTLIDTPPDFRTCNEILQYVTTVRTIGIALLKPHTKGENPNWHFAPFILKGLEHAEKIFRKMTCDQQFATFFVDAKEFDSLRNAIALRQHLRTPVSTSNINTDQICGLAQCREFPMHYAATCPELISEKKSKMTLLTILSGCGESDAQSKKQNDGDSDSSSGGSSDSSSDSSSDNSSDSSTDVSKNGRRRHSHRGKKHHSRHGKKHHSHHGKKHHSRHEKKHHLRHEKQHKHRHSDCDIEHKSQPVSQPVSQPISCTLQPNDIVNRFAMLVRCGYFDVFVPIRDQSRNNVITTGVPCPITCKPLGFYECMPNMVQCTLKRCVNFHTRPHAFEHCPRRIVCIKCLRYGHRIEVCKQSPIPPEMYNILLREIVDRLTICEKDFADKRRIAGLQTRARLVNNRISQSELPTQQSRSQPPPPPPSYNDHMLQSRSVLPPLQQHDPSQPKMQYWH